MVRESSRHGPLWWAPRRVNLNQEQPRILIVDDFEIGALGLAEHLSLEGWDCRAVFQGADAIAFAKSWHPHIVIVDISMLNVDGAETALALRSDQWTKDSVIIAFTALDEREVLRRVNGTEFDGYCQKGQILDALATFIRTAFNVTPTSASPSATQIP